MELSPPPDTNAEAVHIDSTNERPLTVTECVIRRGKCTVHKVPARKTTQTSKKWGKKSTGYGWIYSRKVIYICRFETKVLGSPKISTEGCVINISDEPALVRADLGIKNLPVKEYGK